MSFIAAGEILGNAARVRTLTIAHHPELPDGAYAMVDTYCTDPGCDCRRTIILVQLDHRHVSTINYEDDGTALGLGVAEHAQLGADRIGEHRPGDEAPLVKAGPGTTRSPSWLEEVVGVVAVQVVGRFRPSARAQADRIHGAIVAATLRMANPER